MKAHAIETLVSGLNGLETTMSERTASRRQFLRGAAKALGIAGAAGVALPASRALAAPADRGFKARTSNGPVLGKTGAAKNAKIDGIKTLRAVQFGLTDSNWSTNPDWEFYNDSKDTAFQSAAGYALDFFQYPTDWTLDALDGGAQAGAWMTAPDESALIGWFAVASGEAPQAHDGAWREIDKLAGGRAFDVIFNDVRETDAGSEAFVAISVEGYTLALFCVAAGVENGSETLFSVQFARVDDFDAAAESSFLPFVCQFRSEY